MLWKLKSIMNGTYTQGSIVCLMGGLVRGLVTWNGDGREMVSESGVRGRGETLGGKGNGMDDECIACSEEVPGRFDSRFFEGGEDGFGGVRM
jgi:hypothetical protein